MSEEEGKQYTGVLLARFYVQIRVMSNFWKSLSGNGVLAPVQKLYRILNLNVQ